MATGKKGFRLVSMVEGICSAIRSEVRTSKTYLADRTRRHSRARESVSSQSIQGQVESTETLALVGNVHNYRDDMFEPCQVIMLRG